MEVPNVKRKDYQLIGMDDDFLSMMDDTGDTREDLKCPMSVSFPMKSLNGFLRLLDGDLLKPLTKYARSFSAEIVLTASEVFCHLAVIFAVFSVIFLDPSVR